MTYLEDWKGYGSLEDRDKAVLVHCAQKDRIDMKHLREEAEEKGVEDYLEKVKAYC